MEDLCSLRGTYVSIVHPRMSRITYTFNLSTCTVRVSLQLPDHAHGVQGARCEDARSARAGGIHEVVTDTYIKLLKVQEGLKKRPGGTVYLEIACLVAIMKRDGEKDETIEVNYPNRGTS